MISNLVFFGDSITAAGRNHYKPVGDGYVSILNDMFIADADFNQIKIINSGVNGNKVGDLLNRYQRDVLDHKPEGIVIKIGINDAYQDFISGGDNSYIEMYAMSLDKLLQALQVDQPVTKFFLFTPYLISDSKSDTFYLTMYKYCEVVKSLGFKYNIPVLDVQSVFDWAVEQKPAREWAEDQIHPQKAGHALIASAAYKFLKDHLD